MHTDLTVYRLLANLDIFCCVKRSPICQGSKCIKVHCMMPAVALHTDPLHVVIAMLKGYKWCLCLSRMTTHDITNLYTKGWTAQLQLDCTTCKLSCVVEHMTQQGLTAIVPGGQAVSHLGSLMRSQAKMVGSSPYLRPLMVLILLVRAFTLSLYSCLTAGLVKKSTWFVAPAQAMYRSTPSTQLSTKAMITCKPICMSTLELRGMEA